MLAAFFFVKLIGYTLFAAVVLIPFLRRSEPLAVTLDATGRITSEHTCTGCGYQLKTLLRTGCCPECALPVEESLVAAPRSQAGSNLSRAAAIGAVRTVLGFAVGFSILWLFHPGRAGMLLYVLALIPIRAVEWAVVIVLFFDLKFKWAGRAAGLMIGLGVVLSFLLDILSIIVGGGPPC